MIPPPSPLSLPSSLVLPPPEVIGCYFDIGFMPPIAAMLLRWGGPLASQESVWPLPRGESLKGALPCRFGIRIHRQAEDAYALALLWDATTRQWFSLRRREILGSALLPVLGAMGTRLDYLLEQPVLPPRHDRSTSSSSSSSAA